MDKLKIKTTQEKEPNSGEKSNLKFKRNLNLNQ